MGYPENTKTPPVPGAPGENIAETLVRELPAPFVIEAADGSASGDDAGIRRIAVPKGWEIREIDDEALLHSPRRTRFTADFSDAESFVAYVNHHVSGDTTALWCDYDAKAGRLVFTAVIDDHAPEAPAWRSHRAVFTPRRSVEWDVWTSMNGKVLDQLAFALFLQDNELDITAKENYPTSLQMHQLATDFKYRAELVAKSAVRLMDGTTKLEYADMPDQPTQNALKLVELFCIGIPVFAGKGEPAYRIDARVKVKPPTSGKLAFGYELVRPDRVFEEASQEILQRVRDGLDGVRTYMGGGA